MVFIQSYKYSIGALILLKGITTLADPAPVIEDNPENVRYKADIDTGDVHGIVEVYTAKTTCGEQDDAYCQVGDLSGKHGFINTTCFQLKYYDPYLSLNPDDTSFIGDRSVVVHYNDMSKMACGNFRKAKKRFWKKEYEEEESDYLDITGNNETTQILSSSTLIPTYSAGPSNFTSGNQTNGTAYNDDGTPEVSSTYCDSAFKDIASGLIGTLISLLFSIF
ncbi:hypothetical protein HII13_005295 [Brettanomyces bruxellensis]|nr:hypothetical protein HII13_005295 [Brettanomyces bruxellensis]